MKNILLIIGFFALAFSVFGQDKLTLSLDDVIKIASKKSIISFKNTHEFRKQEWEYNLYKASRLPQIALKIQPSYDKSLFNPMLNYLQPTNFNYLIGTAEVSLQQKATFLGGHFFANSQLSYQEFFDNTSPYASVNGMDRIFGTNIIRIGYRHDLLGYNEFKWEKLLSTLQFEKATKEFVFNMQVVSEIATTYFFQVARANATYEMARTNVKASNTLFQIGQERFAIISIKKDELLALELQAINSRNALYNAKLALHKAKYSMLLFLNIDQSQDIEIVLPTIPINLSIKKDDAMVKAEENNPHYLQIEQNLLQAEQYLEKTTKESKFQANLNISVGIQQLGANIGESYRGQKQYWGGGLTFSTPLFDFGATKSRRQIAHINLENTKYSSEEIERSIKEEIVNAITDFNAQQHLILEVQRAISLADQSFEQTEESYAMGQSDMNSFTLAQIRKDEAYSNYITSLQDYWLSYYKICKITLFDYMNNISLVDNLDVILEN